MAYEAAVEAANAVVGALSALIAREEAKPAAERDEGAIRMWEDEQARCHRVREQLDPANTSEVARLRRHFAERAQVLRGPAGD
ncbi:hypothetical protein I5Q34_07410 [Streptomyces sp. AV19]|uniref:hypothetical protein n=1 Tax=Streptomyces sp. AV19 TaxID=2793068 RepID=UPI0018FEC695|nr:hypothetical protein [Streptomyces sp. AV19]MBH1934123.1 hypothetical protein [Streptomyces sp. AV19]MDG4537155.1 hypothetical protein [Streptomyces sp. AV19]